MRSRARRALSLLELTLVLVIIGAVATIGAPRFSVAQARYRVDVAAQRLAADLEYASVLARTRGTDVTIRFEDGDVNGYWFEGVDDPDRPGSLYAVALDRMPYRSVLQQAPGSIEFRTTGLPKDSRVFILSAGPALLRTVSIDRDNGEITIQ